jgi:endonuclease/exonuclease/phosphatase family metal-dependent hydrolase
MKVSIKILSWNILADEFIQKRYYPMIPPELLTNRTQRQTQIQAFLTQMDMDVMLLQEVMQSEYNMLTNTFQKTHHLLRGKNIKWQTKQSHSFNVILLRKSLFALPARPLITLPFGLGVQCFFHKQNQNKPLSLIIFNIHLDDLAQPERLKQMKELLPYFNTNESVIVGGDFNENYNAKAMSELYQSIKSAGLKILNPKPTYYIERKMCIDNILIKGLTLKHQTAYVLDDFSGDRVKQFITYGSDHLPVAVN